MTKVILAIAIMQILALANCTSNKGVDADKINIDGNWVLKNVFLGDVIDQPCGMTGTVINPNITLKIASQNIKTFDISGKSTVNSYTSKFVVSAFSNTTQTGTMNISPLAITKMAGTSEAMGCEDRFFKILGSAYDFKIEDGKLLIGSFNKDNTPSRDGGTYLIFEKSS